MATNTILKGSRILVTGVNSYLGSHIAEQLLVDDYTVRGTVRSIEKGLLLHSYLCTKYGETRFELTVVEDICNEAAFATALNGVAGICHVATAATLSRSPSEVVPPTVAGAVSILQAAAREPGVKSVVYTSDSFAVWFPRTEQQFTVHPWQYNQDAEVALRKGKRLPAISDELIVWATAKVAAEKAVWNFIKDHQPSFEASSIVPNMNFGPSVRPLPLSSTGTCIPSLLRGEDPTSTFYFPAAHFVNVRDCAKLHIAALLDPEQSERRLFACAAPYSWNDILCILRKLRPHASMRKDYDQFGRDESVLPNDAAEQLLKKWYGHGWTGLEETVRQNIDGV